MVNKIFLVMKNCIPKLSAKTSKIPKNNNRTIVIRTIQQVILFHNNLNITENTKQNQNKNHFEENCREEVVALRVVNALLRPISN